MNDWFRKIARSTADGLGSPWAFLIAGILTLVWGVAGPIFDYSDEWQLIANTVTNVVTFLMVFIIQSSQNRDTTATQLKLDELLRAVTNARSSLIHLESLSDEEMADLERQFETLRRRAATRNPVDQGPRAQLRVDAQGSK
jgi:low affinity Fe/Cu permease